MKAKPFLHTSVLAREVLAHLAPQPGQCFVDCTLGAGGHTLALFQTCADIRVVAFDRDAQARQAARDRLKEFESHVHIFPANFSSIASECKAWLVANGLSGFDGILADLGVSSPQLDDQSRGLSFRKEASDAPIDMRMNQEQGETAFDLIERLEESALADIIFEYGEERHSRRIARRIKEALSQNKLHTTGDLRHAIYSTIGGQKHGSIDPATRTFQALRIAVNQELEELDTLLSDAPYVLKTDGTLAVISFHSLEDRRVKHAFQQKDIWQRITKKPITAADDEIACNPRSRSAKLRVAKRALGGIQ